MICIMQDRVIDSSFWISGVLNDYLSDYQLKSASKDAPCIAPSRVTEKIFAVLVD